MNYLESRSQYIVFLGLILMLVSGLISSAHAELKSALVCQTDNAALQRMPAANVGFKRADGTQLDIVVKLAATAATRAAGFQRVCPSVVEQTPILFLFQTAHIPSFHMRNVVTPLDIAFIKKDGSMDSIRNMAPYVLGSKHQPLYSSDTPVVAALEVIPGFYEKNGIDLSTKVQWKLSP